MLNESLSVGPWQWGVAAVGALMVGVSKTGVAGLGILFVAAFAVVFPSTKQATGIVLPLLILGDFVAVFSYRRHMHWSHLRRLFPWTALGVVIGFVALGLHHADRQCRGTVAGDLSRRDALTQARVRRHGRGVLLPAESL
jgi:uncharacterized membrane protein YfcA